MHSLINRLSVLFICTTMMCFICGFAFAQSVKVEKLATAPALDGSDEDWQGIAATVIPLKKSGKNVTVTIPSASLKAAISGDDLFVLNHDINPRMELEPVTTGIPVLSSYQYVFNF